MLSFSLTCLQVVSVFRGLYVYSIFLYLFSAELRQLVTVQRGFRTVMHSICIDNNTLNRYNYSRF